MDESKKKELEIHGEMMTLLSHLRENEIRVRKKVPMAPTSKQEIKADVRKILEQFLKKQQLKDDKEEGAIRTGAGPPQRLQSGTESETDDSDYDEVISPNEDAEKIAEGRARPAIRRQGIRVGAGPPQRLQSGTESETVPKYVSFLPDTTACANDAFKRLQSGTESETEDTDYDEVISPNEDEEKIAEGKARPAIRRQGIRVGAGPPQRLQSGTESETDDTDYDEVISPNEDAEKIAEGRARPAIRRQNLMSGTDDTEFGKEFISLKEDIERIRVGTARGLQRLMSETEPKTGGTRKTDDYEEEFISQKKDKKRIPVGKPMSAMGLKSGLESETDDADYKEEVIYRRKDIERRKVDAAKPAMGRQRMMSGTESDTDDIDYRSVIIKKRWKSRKKKDIDSSVYNRRDVVQNVHTHKYSHVEQHHYTNGNKSGMLMESDVWECKDLAGKSEHKHGERHSNIMETMRPRHATSGRTNSEKDRLYTAVAEKLAHIGDHYKATSQLSDSTSSSVDHTATRRASARTPNLPGVDERGSDGLTAHERQLVDALRKVGDSFQHILSPDAFKEIAKQAMYQKFQEVVDKETGPGNSWNQIATVFYLTKKVVTMAGVGGAVALQVKDLAAEYMADKFASWIVDQGGWDTFLDSDSDLD